MMRDQSTIQNLVGDDFQLYDLDYNDSDCDDCGEKTKKDNLIIDSDEDQIEQYAQAMVKPLNYQEMPTPICDSNFKIKIN